MATTKVDDIGQLFGDCGRFQITISVVINGANVIAAWGMMFMSFGIYNPGWTCVEEQNTSSLNNYTTHSIVSIPSAGVEKTINITSWSLDCRQKKHCDNLVYNTESSTVVTEWDLSCDLSWIPSIIISTQMVGVFIGAYASGHLGDRFGRKISLYSTVALFGIAQLLASFAVSWQMYAPIMFVIGMGAGGMLVSAFPYPLEFVSEWWRGILTALPTWNLGCIILAIVSFLLKNWRHIHIAAAVASALVFLPVLWTPESVRWLTVRDKRDKAKHIVSNIARMNGTRCPDMTIIDDIATEEKLIKGGYKYGYKDLFKIAYIRGHSFKFGFIWIVLAVSYYSISFGVKSLSGDFYINLIIFSVFEIPSMISIAPTVNKLGRRRAAFIYFAAAATSSCSVVIVTFAASGNVKNTTILVLALITRMFIIGGWFVVCVFSSELYPTVVRSLHFGYLNSIARIGSIVSPYLVPSRPDKVYILYLIIGILFATCSGLLLSIPETKGRILEDRAQDKGHEPTSVKVLVEEST